MKSIIFLLLLGIESAFVHSAIFPVVGFWSVNSFLVFLQTVIFFGAILSLGRKLTYLAVIVESLMFAFLLTYHRYFDAPVLYHIIIRAAHEGLTFAKNSPASLANLPMLLAGLSLAAKLTYIKWLKPAIGDIFLKGGFVTMLVLILVFSAFQYRGQYWTYYDFEAHVKFFGYPQGWLREAFIYEDTETLTEKIIEQSNAKAPELPHELEYLKQLPNHIYIVQVESMDKNLALGEKNGKKIMPYLSALAEKSNLYEIEGHDKMTTISVDYGVLTGLTNLSSISNIMVFVKSFEPDLYRAINPMPKRMKMEGYYTMFFHGNTGKYFDRNMYVDKIGFVETWFDENLPKSAERGVWGVEDKDLFRTVINAGKKSEKTFSYIVTVSSHESFDIGEKHNAIIEKPDGMEDKLYNAMNYVDEALEELVEESPENSLFVIFSDHQSGMIDDKKTLMLIYDKQNPHKSFREINCVEKMKIIKALFNH